MAASSVFAWTCWPWLPASRACDEDLAGERDKEDAHCGGEEGEDIAELKVGHFEAGQAGWDRADHGNPAIGQPYDRRNHDGQHDHDERTWDLGKQPTKQQQHDKACHSDCKGCPAEVGDLPNDLDHFGGWSLSADAQPEQLAELTNNQDSRHAVDVADEYRSGEVIRDPAQPG